MWVRLCARMILMIRSKAAAAFPLAKAVEGHGWLLLLCFFTQNKIAKYNITYYRIYLVVNRLKFIKRYLGNFVFSDIPVFPTLLVIILFVVRLLSFMIRNSCGISNSFWIFHQEVRLQECIVADLHAALSKALLKSCFPHLDLL